MDTSSFSNTPAEMLLRIVDNLPFANALALSETNKLFRKLTAPVLYRAMRVTNPEQDRTSIQNVVDKYGKRTERLTVEIHLLSSVDPNEAASGLPLIIQELLAGNHTPKCTELRLVFIPQNDFCGPGFGDERNLGGTHIHAEPETVQQVLTAERNLPWRSTITEAYNALLSNAGTKNLEIRNLIPRISSAWSSPAWASFLNNLVDVDISLWGAPFDPSLTSEGYHDFVENLYRYFFDHLASVRRLRLCAHPGSPIGGHWGGHTPFPIYSSSLPKLKIFELENFFIDPALQNFLATKAKQLKGLTMIDCVACANNPTAAATGTWSNFFEVLRFNHPVLTELEVTNNRIPMILSSDSSSEAMGDWEDEDNTVTILHRTLQNDPNRQLFVYAYLGSGVLWCDEEATMDAIDVGDDQKEFDMLMGMVAENREKSQLEALTIDLYD